MPSLSYRPFKIENLQDPEYAAIYLETLLEEEESNWDRASFESSLRDVLDALGRSKLSLDEFQQYKDKIDNILSQPGSIAIYELARWLEGLGLKLTVKTDANSY